MDQTKIVTAPELGNYAESRASEAVVPELINSLVRRTVADLTVCRIPHGDSINQPGVDGVVETESGGRQFVPKGRSIWEIGTGGEPQKKATKVFKGRTKAASQEERRDTMFVFVTPHTSWRLTSQERWMKARKKHGWKGIKIVDGDQLADWANEFPAVAFGLLKAMGTTKTIAGLSTPALHWENMKQLAMGADPPLPAKVFLAGREQACGELEQLFQGARRESAFQVESPFDAEDFVAAYLSTLDPDRRKAYCNRCIFIRDSDAWLAVANLKSAHVLVAHPSLDLEYEGEQLFLAARKNDHSIVRAIPGEWAGGSRSLIPLRSPSVHVLEVVLTESGFSLERARELAAVGALTLASLKRHLMGVGDRPPYASRESARLLAQAGLLGRWAGENPADREAIEILLGKSYGEWIEVVRPEILRADTPLIQRNESWKVISRGEAWSALGPRLSNDDLDRFHKMALAVLGERDPVFELPQEERLTASLKGKSLKHSPQLREGIAETLALLGSRPKALSKCSLGKPENIASKTVHLLLKDADWITWASLDTHLPMLAESAPNELLDAVDKALLKGADCPFRVIFAQENGGVFGRNYLTGLLWALETVAWDPKQLVNISILLAELASIDPGGQWANRPRNSLGEIFIPWHPQTYADIPKRIVAVETVLRDQPAVGWKLLLTLLPSGYSTAMGTRRPMWREIERAVDPEAEKGKEYFEQITAYAAIAVSAAASDIGLLAELIDRLPDLPGPVFSKVMEHLSSPAVLDVSDEIKFPLWESLMDLAAKHRRFPEANWVMATEAIERIEAVAATLTPKSPALYHRRLFSRRDFDLLAPGDFAEQRRILEERRRTAVHEILRSGGLDAVIDFAHVATAPDDVGKALGSIEADIGDSAFLLAHLGTAQSSLDRFVTGFVLARYFAAGLKWVDEVASAAWSVEQKADFFSRIPFSKAAWQRAESMLGADAPVYWKKVNVDYWHEKGDLAEAAEKLLEHGRPRAAIACLHDLIEDKIVFRPELATQALLRSGEETGRLDRHTILDLIKWLQENPDTDRKALFQVEWAYVGILDHEFGGTAKTLEREMATEPEFFCEIIRHVYRPVKNKETAPPLTDNEKAIAMNAYRLLKAWKTVPGDIPGEKFDGVGFSKWLAEVKLKSAATGHLNIALNQIGQVLPYAPRDPDGLWTHRAVAEALNAKDVEKMRSGFTCELFNRRGVFGYTAGKDEKKLADDYEAKADALEKVGYGRFATAMRALAKDYLRDAERESQNTPFED